MSQFNFGLNIYNPAQMYFGLNFQATNQQSAFPQQSLSGQGDPLAAFMSAMQLIDSGQIYQNPYGLNFSNNQNQMNAQQQQQLKMMEFFYQLLMMLLEMIMKMYQDYQNYLNNVNNNYTPPGYASGKGATDEAGGVNNAGGGNEVAATQEANETVEAGQPDNHLPVDAVAYEPSGESTPMGESIARRAIEEVNNRAQWQNMNEYWCGAGVGNVLNDLGLEMGRADGSNWDELLQDNPNFLEVSVARDNLDELPPGAVVVWEEKDGISGDDDGDFGHVSIALGDGREASDRFREQLNMQGREYHVFLPKDYVENYPEKFSSNNNNPPTFNTTQTSNNNTANNNITQTQAQTETSRPEPRRTTETRKPQAV